MSVSTPASSHPQPLPGAQDLGLYAITVLAWGFSWIAIKGQIGLVSPETSVFWRFLVAAIVMAVFCLVKGSHLRIAPRDHLRAMAMGGFMFSTNFVLFYHGAAQLPSGLLAVVFSLASVFNMILAFLIFGQRTTPKALAAGIIGFIGVALMFEPQIVEAGINLAAAKGLALCTLGTLCFCLGNMVTASNQRRGLSLSVMTTWGMIYGMIGLGFYVLITGKGFVMDFSLTYISSLLYLAVIASVVAFASYLTLLGRIGSARAGYATVIFPVVALTVSTVLEGYVWTLSAILGLLFVMGGNVLMLRSR